MGRGRGMRAGMLGGASALAIGIAIHAPAFLGAVSATLSATLSVTLSEIAPAAAQGPEAERVYRQEALSHARAIAEAWRRLEDHILRRSGAAVSWTGSIPPAATGWLDAWTERGVRARYCAGTLLVYMEPASLKGVGRDQRAVQVAPHLYAGGDGGPQLAALHWLESGVAEGTAGRPDVAIPACLSDSSFGGPLLSGRVALAGTVKDPHLDLRDRVSHERSVEDCPAGTHGGGRTMTREVRQTHDGRGDPVGDPVTGTWQVSIDDCRADYSEWEHYTLECSWLAGPPHNREMTGQEIWRREKTVTAAGVSWGTPEFVSTSCWEGRVPALPQAQVTESLRTETSSGACPAGYSGTVAMSRTVTERSTLWPWDSQPTMQDIPGNWIADESGCQRIVNPPVHPDKFTPGGPTGPGTGGPGDGACGPTGAPGDSGGSDGPGDGTCSGPGVGPGSGGGNGGGCFLTEAVVEHRGLETDDGPTLTALRAFRDGYMQETPERRALVERYYEIAPRIVAAIPAGHSEWAWIGERVDVAAASIEAGDGDMAFGIYVDMVRHLERYWLTPVTGASS